MASPTGIDQLLHFFLVLMVAYGRMIGLTLLFPVFSWIGQSNFLRNAFAIGFALPMVPYLHATLPQDLSLSIPFAFLLFKEVFVGAMLGLFTALPIWGVQAAGDVIDTYRGASSANLFDPNMALDAPITGMLFIIVMLFLFMISGGMTVVLGAVYDSYDIWPAFSPWPELTLKAAAGFGRLIDHFLEIGIIIAAPLAISMFLAEATLAFSSVLNKRGNLYELSTAVKNMVYTFLMPIYMIFVVKYFSAELSSMRTLVQSLRLWFPPG